MEDTMSKVLSKRERAVVKELIATKLDVAMKRSKAKTVTIDAEYVMEIGDKQGWRCAISGVPLEFTPGVGWKNPFILTIDRKNNSKGYVKGNIQLLAQQVNQAKVEYPTELLIEM